jgi:hypothetical protein
MKGRIAAEATDTGSRHNRLRRTALHRPSEPNEKGRLRGEVLEPRKESPRHPRMAIQQLVFVSA